MSNADDHDLLWNDRLFDWLDGDLPDVERSLLESHLAGCERCQQQWAAFKQLDRALYVALPSLKLDEAFDRRLLASLETMDEKQRAAARLRIESETQRDLLKLASRKRRALAFTIPAIAGGIAVAVSFLSFSDDSGLTRTLIERSAGELGRDTSDWVRVLLTVSIGAGIGGLCARWLSTAAD